MLFEFLSIFIIMYILFYLIYIRRFDDDGNFLSDDKNYYPKEVSLLKHRYNIDFTKINFKRFVNIVYLVSALDIAILFLIAINLSIKSWVLKFIIVLLLTIAIILLSFSIIGNIYKDKEKKNDEL